MDVEWDELRFFLAAWEARSFSKAAEALRVGQATVSRRIAALEERVGRSLFDRTQGGLLATSAGELLHPYAEAMANAARQASAAVQGFELAPEGQVSLALSAGLAVEVVPPYLPELVRRHPKLRLSLVSGATDKDVARHEVDIAIRSEAPETGDLLTRRLADVKYGIFASAAYARALPRKPKLADVDFIGWGGDIGDIAPAKWLASRAKGPPIVTVDNTVTMSAVAKQGIGAVVFPELLAKVAGLVRVPIKVDDLPSTSFFLVVHRAMRNVPRIAVVVDYMLEILEEVRGHA
jgi:DNA-binding transcriptional LysR family regulator